MVSLPSSASVEEEFRRVHTRHRRVLGELNLSVEAMLMPTTPPSDDDDENGVGDNDADENAIGRCGAADTDDDDDDDGDVDGVVNNTDDLDDGDIAAGLDLVLANRMANASMARGGGGGGGSGGGRSAGGGGGGRSRSGGDATTSRVNGMSGAADELLSPGSEHHVALGQSAAGDLDSGFSGSSSGASCMGSLRYRTASGTVRCTTPNGGAAVLFGSVVAAATATTDGGGGGSTRSSQRSAHATEDRSGHHHQHQQHGAVMMMMTTAARSVSACGGGGGHAGGSRGGGNSSTLLYGRALEDPGPSTGGGVAGLGEKKASFWSRKGWRKLSASFSSSGSVHKAGLLSGECWVKNVVGTGNTT